MNRKTLYKWAISVSIVLFLAAMISWGYTQLSLQEKTANIDLYTLVPVECDAILETHNINTLSQSIKNSQFNKDYESFRVSDLLSILTENLDQLSQQKAHGLSTEMSQLLVSFHKPGSPHDQVVYGRLNENDKTFIKELMQHNSSSQFPPKTLKYKGEEITIYSLGKDFLACYFQPGFFAISFQERLIKKVIDAYKSNQSICTDELFDSMHKKKKRSEPLSLYIKTGHLAIGENKKGPQIIALAHWSEFDIRMNNEAIYMTGGCLDTDTCYSFGNLLKQQQPITRISGVELPQHVQMVYQIPFSKPLSTFKLKNKYTESSDSTAQINEDSLYTKRNSPLFDFLKENTRNELDVILFTHKSSSEISRQLLRFPLDEETEEAEKELQRIVTTRVTTYWIKGNAYPILRYDGSNLLHSYFTMQPLKDEYYIAFYKNILLLAENSETLKDYLESVTETSVSNEFIANNKPLYRYCLNDLAEQANFTLVADMNEIMNRSTPLSEEQHILPSFFFHHKEFFKNFMFSTQFIYTNGHMNTNLILTYQGDSAKFIN